ncbi:MAG TPA: carboxypeptidase-like regulatory domain-containing protein, partial [Planctomycetota bacterium]|nr:carboxypeptidase-like regulatory domain-containing protein [Planctomycetota bacterium]
FLVNESGLPQRGRVKLRRESDREIVIEEQETTTDPQGAFQFDDLAPGVVTLVADAPEHATTESGPLPVGPDTVDAVLQLDAGVAWSGRLVDEQGAPVAGARVYLPEISRASGRARGLRGEPVATDARGAFELANVSPSVHSLVVVRADFAPAVVRVGESSDRAAKRDLGELRLAASGALRGQVLDARGFPVPGAVVTLAGAQTIAAVAPRGETAADGTFTIAGLAAGSYALDLVDPAASALAGGFRRKTYELDLAPGETRTVTLDARDDARVRGHVRVSGGAPAESTEVALCAADHSGREIAAAEVDIDGSFELSAPRAGTFLLEVRSLDGPTVRASRLVTLAPRETKEATIELGNASLSGHVSTSGDRTPVPNARVEIETDLGARWMLLADAEGRFRVNGLPAGVVRARALARGFAMAPAQTLRVAEGANATCGFELTPESVVTIQVTDAARRPLPGARVAAWLDDGTFVGDEKTDAKGEVPLRALAGGNLQVVVEHESYAQQRTSVSVTAGARVAQAVEMKRVATLVATLRAPKDQPAAFVDVTVTTAAGTSRTASTDERGVVRFDFVNDGAVSLVAEGFPKREIPVRVGETARVTLSR